MSPKSRRRWPRRLGLGLLLALVVLPAGSREVRFVLRAAWEEGKILLRRQPIADLLADPQLPQPRRQQLQRVLDARRFAAEELGLAAGSTYTRFSDVGSGPLVQVLSASPRDALAAYQWSYPIVGRVPYKGFFDRGAAEQEQRRLERQGYDTYLRPSAAISTLGWFEDPLLSTALSDDPVTLTSTVIHEISHNTLWVPGSVEFNESYANFVGLWGAELFFRRRGESALAERAAAEWRDEMRLSGFYAGLSARLEAFYATSPAGSGLEAGREAIFAAARRELEGGLGGELELYSAPALARQPLNNAAVVAGRIYRTHLELFEAWRTARGGEDPRAVLAEIKEVVAGADDPFGALAAGLRAGP